MKQVKVIVVLF